MRVGVMAMAALAVGVLPAWADAQCAAGERATLAVVGNGEVSRPPEVAQIDISLLTRGPTLGGTSADHRARVAQAAPAIARLKAEGATVDEGTFSLSEERAPAPVGVRPSDGPPTYRAATRYALTVTPLAEVDAIVGEIVSSGLFEVGSIRFAVADDQAAFDDARRAAVADALRQARVYADAAGVRLDGIDRIVDGAAGSRGDGLYDMPVKMARTASVGIAPPKSLGFSGSVTVTWHIVPR